MWDFITKSETYKRIDESLASQVANIPDHFFLYCLYGVIILIAVFWIVRIWKLYKAPGSDLIQQYKENYEKANADSKQKSLILTLIDQVNKEIPGLISLKETDYEKAIERGRKIIDMGIEQIPLCLKSIKDINHRCAVFTVDPIDTSNLKIYEGCGYSIGGKENLRLKISSSIAGKVFTKGEYSYCKDVTKEKDFVPNPKASKSYYSLLCVPIVINGETIAVLSIDGSERNCFSNDDIEYFKMFSNQLAIIFQVMGTLEVKGGTNNEIQNTG
ncbi:GAF domain-containing protein [uncultured Metabacillus sp.]|uniref:GAF domain-containing protein n=1 Tax=uncultured Metabacillus sp. TaxID=2860135 RepID=UPI0026288A6C|nr:GAF domain-containing protein [uncultured Metabacillus sp.]